ncbi:MAG TPA: DUF3016 domain-containing protein [Opitutaceae bacterium]|nr:DUF3016 domain-containing protein [Opitutaceae bacterium]
MRILRLFSPMLGLLAAGLLHGADQPAPRTEVIFDHPEKFTDVKDAAIPTEKGRDATLASIRDFLVRETAPMIPEGYKLRVTFTDIDLAGDFEPWHGARFDDVRFIKSIYPPAFKFTYSVTDPAGKVVREGSEDIRDLTFQMRIRLDSSDPLGYEKDVLTDWAHSNLRGLKKA